MSQSKEYCSLAGCSHAVGNNSYKFNYNKICAKHRKYFDTASNIATVVSCTNCSNFTLNGSIHCHNCNPNSMEITASSIEKLGRELWLLLNKARKINTESTEADLLKATFALQKTNNISFQDAFDIFKEAQVKAIEKKLQIAKRRPTVAKIKDEAKQAAVHLATQKLITKIQSKLPSLISMLNLSPEMTAKINDILASKIGTVGITALLSLIATYVPMPEEYEKWVAPIAEELRTQTMGEVMTVGLSFVGSLMKADVLKDVLEIKDSLSAIASPVIPTKTEALEQTVVTVDETVAVTA